MTFNLQGDRTKLRSRLEGRNCTVCTKTKGKGSTSPNETKIFIYFILDPQLSEHQDSVSVLNTDEIIKSHRHVWC